MVEDCSHVRTMRVGQHTALLNPRNWACVDCGTTESVWACLSCNHAACGRRAEGHAVKHFNSTKHPIAIDINLKYVHCYLCDDWVLNDTPNGDIRLIQSMLGQIASQNYKESVTRSGRVIRPASLFTRMDSKIEEAQFHAADKRYTALFHWKYLVLSKAFNSWKLYAKLEKAAKEQHKRKPQSRKQDVVQVSTPSGRRQFITPGMTGLRNLGNTCYMNAALQSLGHLHFLRETFRQMGQSTPAPPRHFRRRPSQSVLFSRQTTYECFEHISTKPPTSLQRHRRKRSLGRLSGGASTSDVATDDGRDSDETFASEQPQGSLCEEIHGLLRVMWSGKWAVVTPHTVLTAVWSHVPAFRGYCQQDAQEFLCELLRCLHDELSRSPASLTITLSHPHRDVVAVRELLPSLFQGELSSEVTYSRCGHRSLTKEAFWDLSLEFPQRYQTPLCSSATTPATSPITSSGVVRQTSCTCSVNELLQHFTTEEQLDDEVFVCGECHGKPQRASKTLSISHLPEVLRLHLKRFRYSRRSWHKITARVELPLVLDLQPYYHRSHTSDDVTCYTQDDFTYDLSSIIVHHGSGFSCGHYTAYCWNSEAASWVHCNDSRLIRCSVEDVLNCQPYVLFYARRMGRSPVLNTANESDYSLEEPPEKKRKTMT